MVHAAHGNAKVRSKLLAFRFGKVPTKKVRARARISAAHVTQFDLRILSTLS
jgi:translation elongation factor P/translation initiation factor 5A